MISIALQEGADFDGFRNAVRRLLANEAMPEDVIWQSGATEDLFGGDVPAPAQHVHLPASVVSLAKIVACHRDPARYSLLYQLIWRVRNGERNLIDVASDPLVHRLLMMRKSVARDIHKMHAFLRFRPVASDVSDGERFIAWFEPDHFILQEVGDFFAARFPGFAWSILTPVGSLHWDRHALTAGAAAKKPDVSTQEDEFEKGWLEYYRSTFNPARVNTRLMQAEMPKKYWKNLPEAGVIADMVREAPRRVETMLASAPSIQLKRTPERALVRAAHAAPLSLDALNAIISKSEPFVAGGTTAVLGEGPLYPGIAFVGEQPGDQEDIEGRPFVGPAGKVLDRALSDAGISRAGCYVTNAVKHFKFIERGKRRIHQKPTQGEIKHYRWWLEQELELVRPRLIVALGASAAFALGDRAVSISRDRGPASFGAGAGLITIHPSFILRLQNDDERTTAYSKFVEDLTSARQIASYTSPYFDNSGRAALDAAPDVK